MSVNYTRINWEDSPSTQTPLNAENLNKMDSAIGELATAVNGMAGVTEDVADLQEDVNEAVRFDVTQTKTDAEKERALSNIGAVSNKQSTANVGKALIVGENGVVTTGDVGMSDAVKAAFLNIFQKVVYKDGTGRVAYNQLVEALDGSPVPVETWVRVKAEDILDHAGVKDLTITDSGIACTRITDSKYANPFHAIVLTPDIKKARFHFIYNSDYSSPLGHSYVAKVNDDGSLYITTGSSNFVFTLAKNSSNEYYYKAAQDASVLHYTKYADRQDAFVELELSNNTLYAYDSNGTLIFEVGDANCIGIWGSKAAMYTDLDIEILERETRPMTMNDVAACIGYKNPSFTNGVFSHGSNESVYSVMVFDNTIKKLNLKYSMKFTKVMWPQFLIINSYQNGNLRGSTSLNTGHIYDLTYDSADDKYTAEEIDNTDLHMIASRVRGDVNCYLRLENGTLYVYNEDGIFQIINNVDTLGIWSAYPSGALTQFEAEVVM